MSDIGVHSSLYQRVRDYGQMVDEVLLSIRSGGSTRVDPSRRKLGELLVGLGATSPPDLATAWLGMLIGVADVRARGEWEKVGRALLAAKDDGYVIDKLKQLAQRFEEQRIEALAKMRGLRT